MAVSTGKRLWIVLFGCCCVLGSMRQRSPLAPKWTSPGLMDSSYCTDWRVLYEQVQIKDSDSIYRGVSPTDGGVGPNGSQAQATVAGVWLHRMVDPTLVQPG